MRYFNFEDYVRMNRILHDPTRHEEEEVIAVRMEKALEAYCESLKAQKGTRYEEIAHFFFDNSLHDAYLESFQFGECSDIKLRNIDPAFLIGRRSVVVYTTFRLDGQICALMYRDLINLVISNASGCSILNRNGVGLGSVLSDEFEVINDTSLQHSFCFELGSELVIQCKNIVFWADNEVVHASDF